MHQASLIDLPSVLLCLSGIAAREGTQFHTVQTPVFQLWFPDDLTAVLGMLPYKYAPLGGGLLE